MTTARSVRTAASAPVSKIGRRTERRLAGSSPARSVSTPAQRALWAAETEASLTEKVITYARYNGWLVTHFHDSRREIVVRGKSQLVGDADAAGWPDLFLVRRTRAIAAELKSESGRLSLAQKVWLGALDLARVEVWVWRPHDWDSIKQILQ